MALENEKPVGSDEGSVDWEGAANFMSGKAQGDVPPTDADGEPAAFTPKQFKYSGRTVTANTADEAAAIEAMIRESRGANGRLGQENAELRERLARVEGRLSAPVTQEPEQKLTPPSMQLARTDPDAWYAEHLRYEAAMLQQQRLDIESSVRAEMAARDIADRQEQGHKAWGAAFYATNKHLDTPSRRSLVLSAYQQNAEEINSFGNDVAGAHARLAELAEVAIAEVGVLDSKTTTRPPQLESSTRRVTQPQKVQQKEVVTGSSWIAKERARMRGESLTR